MAERLRRVQEASSPEAAPQVSARPRANPDREELDVERGEGKLDRIVGN